MQAPRPFFVVDGAAVTVGREVRVDVIDVAKAYELATPEDDGAWARAAETIAGALPPCPAGYANPLLVDGWQECAKGAAARGCGLFFSAPPGVNTDAEAIVAICKDLTTPWAIVTDEAVALAVAKLAEKSLRAWALPGVRQYVLGNFPSVSERARQVSLLKAADTDEHFVLGIVLEPDTVDSQGDIYDAGEVRRAAHGWMEDFQNMGHMHRVLINQGVKPVESYVAPVDFEIGGQKVKAGTWLLGVHVISDQVWQQVKAGELTGFSIGGYAQKIPAQQVPPQEART